MTLLNPAGLVFSALIPLIILLYLLKLRRQPAQVSTLLFWQRVVADNRRRALFQRLRQLLSLLLHLLIFALLLFALARPELRAFRGTEDGLATVIVLDARARMGTLTGAGRTRFDAAAELAATYLRRASDRQPAALLAVGSAPRVVCGSTGDERTLLDALAGVHPGDTGGRLEDAVQLARDMLGASPRGHGRLVLITDQPLTATGAEVELRLVDAGHPRENVGIVRLAARALPSSPETDEVLVEIQNFGPTRKAGTVELTFEGRLLDVKPFELAPGEHRTDVYPALAAQTGLANARGWLSAHLALASGAHDALPLDDDAYAVIPPPRPLRVLLVTPGNWFLESLLKADAGVQFDQLAPAAFPSARADAFDAVILDDCTPPGFFTDPSKLPPGHFLFIQHAPFLETAQPALEHPPVTDADPANPLLSHVNLRDVTILRADAWALPEPGGDWQWSAPVRSIEHPLVVTGERRASGRLLALAFGVADSDLPLRVAFPLFMHNALTWLAARSDANPESAVRAGETIEVPAGATLWTVPQRSYAPIGPIPAGETLTGPGTFEALRNGYYLLRQPGAPDRWIAVNTLDAAMSAVNAGATAAVTQAELPVVSSAGWQDALSRWPPWMELALIAFVLCTLEWWGFHRRRTE